MVQLMKSSLCLICILGCYFQLETTLSTYLHYQTITETRTFIPDILFEPDLSLCIRYADIVGIKEKDIYNHNLTLKEIFDKSYPPERLISDCYFRIKPRQMVQNFRNEKCLEYFNIQKYFTQEYICYKIAPVHQGLPYRSYTSSLWYPGTIYWISPREEVARKIEFVKPFVHSPGLPLISAQFARYFHRRSKNESSFLITFAINHFHHLGYPYNSFKCSKPGDHARCQANCTTYLSLQKFGKLFYDVVFAEPLNHQILSGQDVKIEGVMDKVQHIHEYCDSVCNIRDCEGNYTLSTVSVSMKDRFFIKVFSPNSPDIEKTSVPKVTNLDLVVYVMSALGTWFGFVVIDIDLMKHITSFGSCYKKLFHHCKMKFMKVCPDIESSNIVLLNQIELRTRNPRRGRGYIPSITSSNVIRNRDEIPQLSILRRQY